MQERFETFTVLINRISRDIRRIKNQEMAAYPIHSRVRVRVSLDTDFSLFYISFQNEFFNQNY